MVALGRRLPRLVIGLALLTMAFAPSIPVAAAAPNVEFTVDIIDAVSHGCSPDTWTQPDLRVRVLINDVLFIETEKGQDQARPLFADAARYAGSMPVVVGIEVDEAEPGGAFGFGTSWVRCQIGPDGGTRFNVTYNGEPERVIVATGAGSRAAQTTVVLGTTAPAMPGARAVDITDKTALITWAGDSGATAHHLAPSGGAAPFASLASDATNHELTDLCDNARYEVRVIREQGPWRLGQSVIFTTTNVAPPPARILSADVIGGRVDLAWDAPQNDVNVFDIHMGPTAEFMPTQETFRETAWPGISSPHETPRVQGREGDAFVRIVTVDLGGLTSVSPAFALDSPHLQPQSVPSCGGALHASGRTTSAPPTAREDEGADGWPATSSPEDTATRLSTDAPRASPAASVVNGISYVFFALILAAGVILAVVLTAVRKK